LIPFIDHDDFNQENTSHKKVRTIISNLGNVDENIDERLFVNTLTRKEPRTERDNDNGLAEEQEEEAYDFRNDDLELRRLRLRLRRSKDLNSKLSMEEEEYIFHKALLKEHNIKSKREYDDFVHEDKKDDIERYFKQKGVWSDKGWYDLLSIDTSKYPSSKDDWNRVCQKKILKVWRCINRIASNRIAICRVNRTSYIIRSGHRVLRLSWELVDRVGVRVWGLLRC